MGATAVLDNHAPQTYMHMHLKLKKMQVEEERLATVERDNRILLEKMSYIMRTKGRVDNHNDVEHKSLNKTKRQRELLRVTHENQAILKRITSKEPHYNQMQWEEEWNNNVQYMENISQYPVGWYQDIITKTQPRKKQKGKANSDSASATSSKESSRRSSIENQNLSAIKLDPLPSPVP